MVTLTIVDVAPLGTVKLHLVAKLDDLEMRLVNHEMEFAEVVIRGLESKVIVKATRTIVQAKLNDVTVEDLTENTLYPRILTIEDDKVFDFKVRYRSIFLYLLMVTNLQGPSRAASYYRTDLASYQVIWLDN